MIRFTFIGVILFFCLACNSKGSKDKIAGTVSMEELNAFISKDSIYLPPHEPRKGKQIWLNSRLEERLLGKDSVFPDRSPLTLTIDKKGAFMSFRFEGSINYFPFKLGMKDYDYRDNYRDMNLTTLSDSVIDVKWKNGKDFTFVLRLTDDNGMPDLSKSLLRNLLPPESLESISIGESKKRTKVLCTERNWSNAAFCQCNGRYFKYKLFYNYPVQTNTGMSNPLYYIELIDQLGLKNTYEMERHGNKILLKDLTSHDVLYTWYIDQSGDKNVLVHE